MVDEINIKYECELCGQTSTILVNQQEFNSSILTQIDKTSIVPSPSQKISSLHKYLDHEDHSIHLEINVDGGIISSNIIPKIKTVIDSLVQTNVNINRITNNNIDPVDGITPCLVIITNSPYFKVFLNAKIHTFVVSGDKIIVNQNENFIRVDFTRISLIMGGIDHFGKIKNNIQNKKSKITNNLLKIRSLILDITSHTEEEFQNKLKNLKGFLDESTKVILLFNTRNNKLPPIGLRDYLENKLGIKNIDILNFYNTDSIKAIILQGYYNLFEDSYKIRDLFERHEKEFRI